jgi:hypothetical protein
MRSTRPACRSLSVQPAHGSSDRCQRVGSEPQWTRPAARSILRLLAGLLPMLALATTSPAAAQSCTPSTVPCQTCPLPTSCGTPAPGCFQPPGGGNVTATVTELSCVGSFPQETVEVQLTIGGAGPVGTETILCIGPGAAQPVRICAGTQNINTILHTITVSPVAIPTLSVWGLVLVGGGLGVAALRRLRRRSALTAAGPPAR